MRKTSFWPELSMILMVSSIMVNNGYAAESEKVTVKLQTLKSVQQQERNGDELYISVTEFTSSAEPRHYQIPSAPTHWLSRYLGYVKEVVLWQKPLTECEQADVIFSLVEQDLAPWNVDDLLGSVELKVRCDKGKFVTQWVIPNKNTTHNMLNIDNGFSFTGNHAHYDAVFKVEQSDVHNTNKIVSPVDPMLNPK